MNRCCGRIDRRLYCRVRGRRRDSIEIGSHHLAEVSLAAAGLFAAAVAAVASLITD